MTIQQWENDLLQWIPSTNIKINETLKKYTMTIRQITSFFSGLAQKF